MVQPHKHTKHRADWAIIAVEKKGTGFCLLVCGFSFFPSLFLSFFPSFLIAKPAIGVENGEGGREENLVNSWGPSLFIAGLGEMWLTE